jgi:dolichol-phosphate mannosyltransferase
MRQLAPDNHEIIIVNDGSTDGSHELILKEIANKQNFIYEQHKQNLGIGQALKTGYRLASKENICAVPGDCQFNFHELLSCPNFTDKQFVSYYRKQTHYNVYRKFLNHFNRLINYLFLGVNMNDVNWIKVYKKSQIDSIELTLNSSLVESEICAKLFAYGISCIEIKSEYLERLSDASKGGAVKTVKQAALDLFKLIKVTGNYKNNSKSDQYLFP